MKKNITKLSLLLSGIALSFGFLIGIKPNNIALVNAETTSRCGVEAEWEEWTSTTSLPTSGYYYLGNNVTITSNNITLSGTVLHLDLNGNTVSFEYEGDNSDNAITLSKGSEFSLYDSTGTGVLERKNAANYERFIYLERPTVIFNLNGGTIRNFKNSNEDSYGGAVHIYSGTFNMNGGVITDCEAAHGGAVCVGDYGRANLSGGEIFNNTSTIGNGGAILILSGNVRVSGSIYIHDNSAKSTGGAFHCGFSQETGEAPTLFFDGGVLGENRSELGCAIIDKDSDHSVHISLLSGRFVTASKPYVFYCESDRLVKSRSNITFDKNGGTGGTDSLSSVTWNSNLSNIDVPTFVGHTFLGYFDQYGVKYFDALGRPTNKEMSSIKWDYVGNQTLYAKWSANTYTVNLNSRGGFGGSQSTTVTYGKDMPKIELPYKSGFEFLGYFLSIDGGKQYYNADGSSCSAWDKTEGATLYAHWEYEGVDTAMKLAFNYVNSPNSSNVFRLMCAVDEVTLSKVASSQHIMEYGIYIKKEDNFVARFDINQGSAVINNEFIEKADIYKEGDYKYILIDLGDLLGEDKDNVNVTYTVHSYLKTGDVIDVSTKQCSYSFASLLDSYLAMPEYKDNASLKQCKEDLGF